MKLNIHPTVILRSPKFSYQANLEDCWDELKDAIAISSEAFYQIIKDVTADQLHTLPPKVSFTVWKYFNRAKFRSTPYGTFASVSLLKDGIGNESARIVIDEKQDVIDFIDWPQKNELNLDIHNLLSTNCLLFSNNSYYFTTSSIRYIGCSAGIFELAEIDKDELVLRILEYCLTPITVKELLQHLEGDAEKEFLLELLVDMHNLQLIFTDYDPNIIGEDYFQRTSVKKLPATPKYIISERKALGGQFANRYFKHLEPLIFLLSDVMPSIEGRALNEFIKRFKHKFEQREVPLLQALDPEMGVGYDELEQADDQDDFINQLKSKNNNSNTEDILTEQLKEILIPSNFEKGVPIFLNRLLPKSIDQKKKLPNSFSASFSVANDLICIDQIGGSTANALTGRFTLGNKDIEGFGKNIAQLEKSANPGVLFFDVAYMVENNVDNINRRKLLYDSQLSILNFDTSQNPIHLNDIMISIVGAEVVLRSKSLNKRVVPKIASAYNYTRSDLSVFRLLCDLQHQNVQAGLSLTLDSLFPDLDYYPRFQYHNIVLNLQRWKVQYKHIPKEIKEHTAIDNCKEYLRSIGVSRYFTSGRSDQKLVFDIQSHEDVNAFMLFLQNTKSTYIEEIILPDSYLVTDQLSRPYMHQAILSIYHQDEIYQPISKENLEVNNLVRIFPPGGEWLYFEIYCHQERSDQIINDVISPFLTDFASNILSWFFIRYNDSGDHLRFRILLNDKNDSSLLTAGFSQYLKSDLEFGLVSDLQIKTYKREFERYGSDLIEVVEKHFYKDSQFVLTLLNDAFNDFDKYYLCSLLVDTLLQKDVFDLNTLFNLVKLLSDAFNQEHQIVANHFKAFNDRYKLYKTGSIKELNPVQYSAFNEFAQSFTQILMRVKGERLMKMFSDLMHMHVNRLFKKNQRTHEMLMYYFLLKDLHRKISLT